ncbi:MAG: hypothetical protein LBL66_05875 [Clostridiales bacterium]|jgi:hypothetical protein|nr:hypothetical protein [Clostridiales bacterium]
MKKGFAWKAVVGVPFICLCAFIFAACQFSPDFVPGGGLPSGIDGGLPNGTANNLPKTMPPLNFSGFSVPECAKTPEFWGSEIVMFSVAYELTRLNWDGLNDLKILDGEKIAELMEYAGLGYTVGAEGLLVGIAYYEKNNVYGLTEYGEILDVYVDALVSDENSEYYDRSPTGGAAVHFMFNMSGELVGLDVYAYTHGAEFANGYKSISKSVFYKDADGGLPEVHHMQESLADAEGNRFSFYYQEGSYQFAGTVSDAIKEEYLNAFH